MTHGDDPRQPGAPPAPAQATGPNAASEALQARLMAWLARQYGRPVTVDGLVRLAGGVSRETWAFDVIGGESGDGPASLRHPLILRMDTPQPFIEGGRAAEAALIRLAGRHGVPVPRVLWSEDDAEALGAPFLVMERVPGEASIPRLHRESAYAHTRQVLPGQMAATLAQIHRITPHADPHGHTGLRELPQAEAVAWLERLYRERAVEPHPVLELALRWLAGHLPPEAPPALVHGDYRTGNVMFDESGLVAVLDWELAYWGDPLADVAWVALRSWRGGHDDLPVGGLATREAFHQAYAEAGGRAVEPALMHFWDVYALVRWAVITLMELRGFLEGLPNIELAAMGRRTAEIEWDLLDTLEREA